MTVTRNSFLMLEIYTYSLQVSNDSEEHTQHNDNNY